MCSALKQGWKHQRQRKCKRKWEKHITFVPVGFMEIPPTPRPHPPFSFLLPKPGIHSFKSIGNPFQNERDHTYPNPENLSFFFFLSPLFFPFFFLLLHIFCSYFFLFFLSELTPFCAASVSGTRPIRLGLPQLHKHSSIPKVHSWPHLLLSLTTKHPSGPKVGCKKPITCPKLGPNRA